VKACPQRAQRMMPVRHVLRVAAVADHAVAAALGEEHLHPVVEVALDDRLVLFLVDSPADEISPAGTGLLKTASTAFFCHSRATRLLPFEATWCLVEGKAAALLYIRLTRRSGSLGLHGEVDASGLPLLAGLGAARGLEAGVVVAHHEPHADPAAALERGEELPPVAPRVGERDAAPSTRRRPSIPTPMATSTAQSITAPPWRTSS